MLRERHLRLLGDQRAEAQNVKPGGGRVVCLGFIDAFGAHSVVPDRRTLRMLLHIVLHLGSRRYPHSLQPRACPTMLVHRVAS